MKNPALGRKQDVHKVTISTREKSSGKDFIAKVWLWVRINQIECQSVVCRLSSGFEYTGNITIPKLKLIKHPLDRFAD